MRMPSILTSLTLLFLVIFFPSFGHSGGWLIHHVGSFKGKVIDAETKGPIAGAVVVAQYHVEFLGPIGWRTQRIDVQETVTNDQGEFLIPPFTKGINPLSIGDDTSFLIWKPGYKKDELWGSHFFSKEPGTVEERPVQTPKGFVMKKVTLGIVELTKLNTKEERLLGMPSPAGDFDQKQKELIKAINEERKNLGLKGKLKED